MASMNRNTNLEEIGDDSFAGISFLRYQTMLQKVIFWGITILASAIMLYMVYKGIGKNIAILVTLVLLLPAVLFGCNYNKDLTLFRYLVLVVVKPSREIRLFSTEAPDRFLCISEEMKKNERTGETEDGGQKSGKLSGPLILLLVFAVVLALLFGLSHMSNDNTQGIHHTVETDVSAVPVEREAAG